MRLCCEGLSRAYGDQFRLGPLNLVVETGVTCFVGPNGAGKSTLFRLVSGLERPTAGTVRVDTEQGGTGLGYLPQEAGLPPRATCEQFLEYVAWLQGVPADRRTNRVARALDDVGLAESARQQVRTLSGGMARRLGIAHALVHDPGVLLLDEPTVALDPRQRVELREAIRAIADRRIVMVSTHLVEDVRSIADRVIVLDRGAVVFDGDVDTLENLSDPAAAGDTSLEQAITALMGAAG